MSTANDIAASAPLFIELRPGLREALAAAVDAFVTLLDQIDSDADLEDADAPEDDAPCEDVGDDEPSLGSVGSRDASLPQYLWSQGADDDREDESELLEPTGDDEPTLFLWLARVTDTYDGVVKRIVRRITESAEAVARKSDRLRRRLRP